MHAMYKNLVSVRISIDDSEYTSIIIHSLSKAYQTFITPVVTSAHLAGHIISANILMTYVMQEYNRLSSSVSCPKAKETDNIAMSVEVKGKRK